MTKSNVLFIARIFRVLVILVRGLLMLLCVGYFYDAQRADMAAQLSVERERGEAGVILLNLLTLTQAAPSGLSTCFAYENIERHFESVS